MALNIQQEKNRVEKMSGANGGVTHSSDMSSSAMPQDILYSGYIKPWRYQGQFVELNGQATIGDDMLRKYQGYWQVPYVINVDGKLNMSGPNPAESNLPSVHAIQQQNMPPVTINTNSSPTNTTSSATSTTSKGYIYPIAGAVLLSGAGALIFHEHRILGSLGGLFIGATIGYFLMKK